MYFLDVRAPRLLRERAPPLAIPVTFPGGQASHRSLSRAEKRPGAQRVHCPSFHDAFSKSSSHPFHGSAQVSKRHDIALEKGNSAQVSKLHDAALDKGSSDKLRALLTSKTVNVDALDEDGFTALIKASARGHEKYFAWLANHQRRAYPGGRGLRS